MGAPATVEAVKSKKQKTGSSRTGAESGCLTISHMCKNLIFVSL